MIQSMTGYAASAAESARGTLSLEIRAVNSRYLDVQMRIADELRSLEPLLREQLAARVVRGKIDCRLSFSEGGSPAGSRLNAAMLARLKTLAAEAKRAFPDAAGLRIADVLRWPGM